MSWHNFNKRWFSFQITPYCFLHKISICNENKILTSPSPSVTNLNWKSFSAWSTKGPDHLNPHNCSHWHISSHLSRSDKRPKFQFHLANESIHHQRNLGTHLKKFSKLLMVTFKIFEINKQYVCDNVWHNDQFRKRKVVIIYYLATQDQIRSRFWGVLSDFRPVVFEAQFMGPLKIWPPIEFNSHSILNVLINSCG